MAAKMEANDWQVSCAELKQRGAALLRSGQWSDCTFLVGAEGSPVRAHRLLLAMASPVFEKMFYGTMAEQNPILIPDMELEAFNAMIEYIYTDKIKISSSNMACRLYYGALKYILPHLLTACTNYLQDDLSPQNVCQVYEFTEMYEIEELKKQSIAIMKDKTSKVLRAASFEKARLETVEKIFSMEALCIKSELVLFHAAKRYAEAQRNTDEVNETIRGLIRHVHFLMLTPKQFVDDYKSLSTVLTESEFLAILMNLNSADASVAMPVGFSTRRIIEMI